MSAPAAEALVVVAGNQEMVGAYMAETIGRLMAAGAHVLASPLDNPNCGTATFISREQAECRLAQITEADALLVVNHPEGGLLGMDTALQIAHAGLCGTPLFLTHRMPGDRHSPRNFTGDISRLEEQALTSIGSISIGDSQPNAAYWRYRKAEAELLLSRHLLPQSTHPDHVVLAALRQRGLVRLPMRATVTT